jgi:DNA-binding IclR family transcriptional regulator
MSIANQQMVNENYEPSSKDEQVLNALKQGRKSGEPWGRANPRWLIDETGLEKSNVEFCLRSLRNAGWIERVARGLYEFAEDPREDDDA